MHALRDIFFKSVASAVVPHAHTSANDSCITYTYVHQNAGTY